MQGERSILVRRAVLFGVPFLYLVLGLLHPTTNPEVGDETGIVHRSAHRAALPHRRARVRALAARGGAWTAVPPRVARALILPFVIVYTALDAVLGIAWGIVAEKANELPVADQRAARPAHRRPTRTRTAGLRPLLRRWPALARRRAHRRRRRSRGRAPRPALVLMAIGATVFALGHAPTDGTDRDGALPLPASCGSSFGPAGGGRTVPPRCREHDDAGRDCNGGAFHAS